MSNIAFTNNQAEQKDIVVVDGVDFGSTFPTLKLNVNLQIFSTSDPLTTLSANLFVEIGV